MFDLPVRPEISLPAILGYSFLSFVIGLLLAKPFVGFLRKYKMGKQLRVEAVDGGTASVFLTYHKNKAGTPTMGGILIWSSILVTVVLSRILSLYGTVDHSLLQRGQVYLPLYTMLCLGLLGAIDDYLNIISKDPEKTKSSIPMLKKVIMGSLLLILGGAYILLGRDSAASLLTGLVSGNPLGILVIAASALFLFALGDVGGKTVDALLGRILVGQGKKAGLNAWPKLLILLAIGGATAYWFNVRLEYQSIHIPFGEMLGLNNGMLQLGWWYIPLFLFVLIGTSNAVNVTDGLDGLAAGLLIIAFGAFGFIAYVNELYVLAAFCGVVAGAIAAFLWHNIPPAIFFMGDTGSLAFGGTLAVIAFMTDQVLILPLIGFVFVIEMLSVIVQLTSKRFFRRKVFKSAPFHHHLEALEWGESKVTMRLWIIGVFFALLGVVVGIYG